MSQENSYSDARFGARAYIKLNELYTMTSVQASAGTVSRATVMGNVTVKDWNIQIGNGATCTGATAFKLTLNASLAGTGALVALSTATLAGTSANNSVVDATVTTGTAANLSDGDDLVVCTVAGTALPADSLTCSNLVLVQERFV